MIFSEDAILLSFFDRYDNDEDELKEAILKYCQVGSNFEAQRPTAIDPVKGDITDLD
jgi:hypothetical protein